MNFYGLTPSQIEQIRTLKAVSKQAKTDLFRYDLYGSRSAEFFINERQRFGVQIEQPQLAALVARGMINANPDPDGCITSGCLTHLAHEAIDTDFLGPLGKRQPGSPMDNLTDGQRELVRLAVAAAKSAKSDRFSYHPGSTFFGIIFPDGDSRVDLHPGDIQALTQSGYTSIDANSRIGAVTRKAYDAVEHDFKVPPSRIQPTIGNVGIYNAGPVTDSNMQAAVGRNIRQQIISQSGDADLIAQLAEVTTA